MFSLFYRMKNLPSFEQFVASQTPHVGLLEFGINLLLTLFFSGILSHFYVRFGRTLSNRRSFSRNLVLISLTTMVIITVVKSSLALSLGLVGALSIVRFRTPIKEPEELAYLFISIALGLGFGAGQRAVIVIGFCVLLFYVWFSRRSGETGAGGDNDLHLSISVENPSPEILNEVTEILSAEAEQLKIRRIDEKTGLFQGDFSISVKNFEVLSKIKDQLRSYNENLQLSILDNNLL